MWVVTSSDCTFATTASGKSWTKPTLIAGAGCVRPKLLTLSGGAVLLSGGRECYANRTDVSLWSATGESVAANSWRRFSLSGNITHSGKATPSFASRPIQ